MTLDWRGVFDPVVLMFKVVPVYKTVYPYSGIINSAKTVLRLLGIIFECLEQRFWIRIIIADLWPGIACQRLNHPVPEVGKKMLKEMMRRMWPNNVRELANAAGLFTVGVLPLAGRANPLMHAGTPTLLDRRVEEAEWQIITEALNIHQGRINEVAEYLQIPRKKLYLRMKKYGLSKEHYKNKYQMSCQHRYYGA